jgi:ADP-ribosylation factor GTPase-activating protein 2/3
VKSGVSFEEAEKRAKEEEERNKAEDLQRKVDEEDRKRGDPLGFSRSGGAGTMGGSSRLAYIESAAGNAGDEDALDRLGMGLGRLGMSSGAGTEKAEKKQPTAFGFGYDPTDPPKKPSQAQTGGFGLGGFGKTGPSASAQQTEDEDFARKKFAGAKAISSDQYFGRGHWNEEGGNEAREKLRGFEGRSAFGSADYYGRKEDEVGPGR